MGKIEMLTFVHSITRKQSEKTTFYLESKAKNALRVKNR